MAQSGCLPFGSLLTAVPRQSAIHHRLVGFLSCGSQQCNRGMRSLCKHLSRWAVAQVLPAISSSWHVRHNSSQSHKRELVRATAAKHRSPSRLGPLVLIGCAFAPQPNVAVKWDADKLQRFGTALWAPLTSALGLVISQFAFAP